MRRAFADALKALGFTLETVPLHRIGGRVMSKEIDVLLGIKAATLPASVGRFVLVSGDSDFVPLLKELKYKGVSTVLLALPIVVSRALSAAAMRFVSLESFLQSALDQSVAEKRTPASPLPPAEVYIEKGQHFGPYKIIRDLFKSAGQSITVIDPYIDDQIFDLVGLTAVSVKITILTNKIQASDYATLLGKLRREGRHVRLYRTKDYHDRFLRIDAKWWHSVHSFKDLGSANSRLSRILDAKIAAKASDREAKALQTATELSPP